MPIALTGATPIRTAPYPAWPHFDESEEQALLRSLRQGQWWRAHGAETNLFEDEFAKYHGTRHALAVSTGTHALEVALLTADIGPGDEVIVPAFTFISTSMAVQRVGATPVAVDVDLETYCLAPEAVEKAITPRTKALIPVHMSGHFADMTALSKLADTHNLVLIQDAAHAHGAQGRGGRSAGEWGSMACFSFQNFKLMTAGEGGAILFPDAKTRDRAFLFSNCGRPLGDLAYTHTVCGSNYRMNEFSSAVLRAQLARLTDQTERRQKNAAAVLADLGGFKGIIPQGRTADAVVHPYYMFMFRLDPLVYPSVDRNQLVKALVAEGIPAFRAYQSLYRIPSFWVSPHPDTTAERLIESCPASEAIAGNGIWIHHRALLGSREDALDINRALERVLAHAEHLSEAAA